MRLTNLSDADREAGLQAALIRATFELMELEKQEAQSSDQKIKEEK
jgi:hypothetical protein